MKKIETFGNTYLVHKLISIHDVTGGLLGVQKAISSILSYLAHSNLLNNSPF